MTTHDPLDGAASDELNKLLQDTIQCLEDSYSKFLRQEQEGEKEGEKGKDKDKAVEKGKEDNDSAVWLDDFIVGLLSWKADINASEGSLKSIKGKHRATRIANILISLKDGCVRELESSSDNIGTENVRKIEPQTRAFYDERLQLLQSYTDTILDHFWTSRTDGKSAKTLQSQIEEVRDICLAEGGDGSRRIEEIQQSVLPHAGVASSDETTIQVAIKGFSQAEGQDRPESQAEKAVPRNSPIDLARRYSPIALKPKDSPVDPEPESARHGRQLLEEHSKAKDSTFAHSRGFSVRDIVVYEHELYRIVGISVGAYKLEPWPTGPKYMNTVARFDELELYKRVGSSPERDLPIHTGWPNH